MTPLFPYQDDGVAFLASRERAGCHDAMGLGKSAQLIRAANAIDAKRGIVVCPAKLRDNWLKEFRLWSTTPLRVSKGNNIYDFTAWQRGRHNILVTSYELATKWAQSIYNDGEIIDFVGLDEGHYVKNTGSQRTAAILGPHNNGTDAGVIRWAEHVWHLSGTPMANDPIDIYTFLRMCNATPLSKQAFIKRYFYSDLTAYGSRQTIKPEMLMELNYLLENNRIQRTKKQAGIQLPPIFLTSVVVDGDTQPIADLLKSYPGLEHSIMAAVEQGGLSFLDAQHIMTLRRLLGEAKSIPYAYILADELKITGEKRIVFGHHVQALQNVYDILWHHGVPCVMVTGAQTDKQAQAAEDEFQTNPQCLVFIGNMQAAGEGRNLTAANELDILESDWTPKGNAQAIMRAHRIGQHRNVYARFVMLARTFDVAVCRLVAQKVRAIAEIEGEPMNAMAEDYEVAA